MNWKLSLVVIPFLIAVPFIPNWLTLKTLIPVCIYMCIGHLWFLKKHFISCMKMLLLCDIIYIVTFALVDILVGEHCVVLFVVMCVTEIIGFVCVSEINYDNGYQPPTIPAL